MEQYMWIIWLSLFVIMLIVEALGPALVSVWFAFGALIAMIISFIPGVAWWIQVVVFVVLSAAAFFALRPISKKFIKTNEVKSNVDSLVGKKGYVIEKISFLNPGSCKIGDVIWTAVALNEKEEIEKDEVVEVVTIDGNKLIVKKVEVK